jgi:hypothetical protein
MSARKKKARGAYRGPNAAQIADARRRFAAAEAAVRVAIVGSDLTYTDGFLHTSLSSLTRALSFYVAVTHLGAPKKVLAASLGTSVRLMRRYCTFIEAWRGAPLIDDALARVEAALPRSL